MEKMKTLEGRRNHEAKARKFFTLDAREGKKGIEIVGFRQKGGKKGSSPPAEGKGGGRPADLQIGAEAVVVKLLTVGPSSFHVPWVKKGKKLGLFRGTGENRFSLGEDGLPAANSLLG